MFRKKYVSLDEKYVLENASEDIKSAKRLGQYKISKNAIYKPDGSYLATAAITGLTHDKASVHVSGCCAGGVLVERIIFDTENGRYPFLFDSVKDIKKLREMLEK